MKDTNADRDADEVLRLGRIGRRAVRTVLDLMKAEECSQQRAPKVNAGKLATGPLDLAQYAAILYPEGLNQ